MPNKIHRRRLNLHELVMHAMIPFFRSFILLQLRSHHFHVFHRGCLCLHYLLRANPCPMHLMAIDTTLQHVHLHREMNHHFLLRTHHHLRFFLNRWTRSYLRHLPVQSLTGERLTHQFTKRAYRKGAVLRTISRMQELVCMLSYIYM